MPEENKYKGRLPGMVGATSATKIEISEVDENTRRSEEVGKIVERVQRATITNTVFIRRAKSIHTLMYLFLQNHSDKASKQLQHPSQFDTEVIKALDIVMQTYGRSLDGIGIEEAGLSDRPPSKERDSGNPN